MITEHSNDTTVSRSLGAAVFLIKYVIYVSSSNLQSSETNTLALPSVKLMRFYSLFSASLSIFPSSFGAPSEAVG